MSRKKRRETPQWKWEQALIDAYYDYRWHQVLDPLYERFRCWEAGELTHHDMDQAIHETHKQDQELYSLFTQSRSFLVGAIQWDEEWFEEWIVDHPPPPGIQLVPRRVRAPVNGKEKETSKDVAESN
jgi:hypothetical protein